MNYKKEKPSQKEDFIQSVVKEIYLIVETTETGDPLDDIAELVKVKLRESFKNGIEVGKKLRNNKSQKYYKKQ